MIPEFIVSTECNRENCDPNYCNDVSCERCLPGYYKYHSGDCIKCNLGCKNCKGGQCFNCFHLECFDGTDICDYANCSTEGCSENDAAWCSVCPDGFYLDRYCYRCNNINCKCSSASGCDECLPGHYDVSNFCNSNCSTNCLRCSDSAYCTECGPGKYGISCEHNCKNTCEDGTCDKESGTCLTQCAAEEYLDETEECQPCPSTRCSSCVNSTFCDSCKQPFHWNPTCAYDCVACYDKCDRLKGCSSGCSESVYYNTYSSHKKGYECIHCPSQCKTCLNDTYCTSCKESFWGIKCLYSCNNCAGTCDKYHGCIGNCDAGYYRLPVDTGHECKPCSEHCEQCVDSSTCHVCEDRYYIDGVSDDCIDCSVYCSDSICDNKSGTCTSGCLPGSTGHRCNDQCQMNCVECEQFNSSYCYSCKGGFHGGMCKLTCSQNCKLHDGIHECEKEDGTCIYGCEDKYWTKTCTEACPDGCTNQACNETNGECLHGCKIGYHGANCSLKCPDTCSDDGCFQENGICKSTCIPGSANSQCGTGK